MKFNRLFICLGIAAIVLAVALTLLATTIPRPPTTSEVAGVYSGYSDQVEFLRLELDSDCTGYLCVSYLTNLPAELYRVESWRLSDGIVELQTHPLDKGSEAVTFRKLQVGLYGLDGEFGGAAGWKRQIKLYGERDWQSRAVPAQERIARYRKGKQR